MYVCMGNMNVCMYVCTACVCVYVCMRVLLVYVCVHVG